MNVILDIDETFCQFVGKDDWAAVNDTEKAKYEVAVTGGGVFILRPRYKEFFQFLQKKCKTINLWTWSDEEYAHGVKKIIESKVPGVKISNVWFDTDVDASIDLDGFNKDLNYIWYEVGKFSPCDTILVDDLEKNTQNPANKRNGIQLTPFEPLGHKLDKKDKTPTKIRGGPYKDMSNDDTLLKVMGVIEKAIKNPGRPFADSTKVGGRRHQKTRRCRKNKCRSIRRKTT